MAMGKPTLVQHAAGGEGHDVHMMVRVTGSNQEWTQGVGSGMARKEASKVQRALNKPSGEVSIWQSSVHLHATFAARR